MWGSSFKGFLSGFIWHARDKDALMANHMFAHNEEVHWDMNLI
jgi:hypothetical protein